MGRRVDTNFTNYHEFIKGLNCSSRREEALISKSLNFEPPHVGCYNEHDFQQALQQFAKIRVIRVKAVFTLARITSSLRGEELPGWGFSNRPRDRALHRRS